MKIKLFFFYLLVVVYDICTNAQHYSRSHNHGKNSSIAYLNSGSKDGDTPLHLSIKRGYVNISKIIIEGGANINSKDSYGDTPSHKAAIFNNLEVMKLLIEKKANINLRNNENETPLLIALANDNFELVKLLVDDNAKINYENVTGQNPLVLAIKQDNVKVLKLFLDKGVKVNDRVNGASLIELAVMNASVDVTRFLLEHGADYTIKTKEGDTLLYFAIYNDYLEIADLLLNATFLAPPLHSSVPIF